MKRISQLLISVLTILSVFSCSDEFLDKNKNTSYINSDTIFITNKQISVDLDYSLLPLTDKTYTIAQLPKWLSFDSMHGEITDGKFTALALVDSQNPIITPVGKYKTQITLRVDDFGYVVIPVAYLNYGNPTLQVSANRITFESLNTKTLSISNTTSGLLAWKLTNTPDWLVLSKKQGTLLYGQSETISVYCDPSVIQATQQDLTATIHILSNSPVSDYPIQVTLKANAILPGNVSQISGTVTDAEYNKATGLMAICTKSPNSLILFNTNTGKSNTIPLSKTPACISLSEDGGSAVIGYSVASLSYIDLNKQEISKEYELDCLPYDVVLSGNWCYFTPTIDQWVFFRSLNLNTGAITVGKNWSTLYERALIKKIPGKPYLVGTNMGLSTSGILIFDISKGIASDTITNWFESTGKFWLSEDGKKMYSSLKKVYPIPQYDYLYHPLSPPIYGQIEGSKYIQAFDECAKKNVFFAASGEYSFSEATTPKIEVYDLVNLNKLKDIDVSTISKTISGYNNQINIKFIFADATGTNLYVIKNLYNSTSLNNWSIEQISLN